MWLAAAVIVVVLVAAWALGMPYLAAEIDRRSRLVATMAYTKQAPRGGDETEDDFICRIHAHLLRTFGIPPLAVVRVWARKGSTPFVPPPHVLKAYMAEHVGKPLADGRPDQRITNGQGAELLRKLEEHYVYRHPPEVSV